MVRILTYNVHRCVGADRKLDIGRIAAVIAAQSPDIVALQEVDVGRARTAWVDQAHRLAERLGMAFHFNAALTVAEERYGDAILTALPQRLIKAGSLPGHPLFPGLEARGALWAAVELGAKELHVVNTHLGLVPREQRHQATALLGPAWLGASSLLEPLVLVGDFNATARTATYRMFAKILSDARRAAPTRIAAPTFPSRWPVLAIDHVFVTDGVVIDAVRSPLNRLTRAASDHLPLVVDFHLAPP